MDRVKAVEPDELGHTKADLEEIYEQWNAHDYDRWEELKPKAFDTPMRLMHPLGANCSDDWSTNPFEVPTSMRSVDSECSVKIVGSYGSYGEPENR